MYFLILLLPVLNTILGLFFTQFLGGLWIRRFIVFFMFLGTWIVSFILCEVLWADNTFLILWNWIDLGILQVNIDLLFDSVTITMFFVVFSISTLVHVYSLDYMKYDPSLPRFLSYLSLFTFFMLVLVSAGNFLQMFIGWEGVGLSSYLLISFWHTRLEANKAAIKAMMVNRIGDVCLLFALSVLYIYIGSFEYGVIFNYISLLSQEQTIFFNYQFNMLDVLCLMLFIGSMSKSAQLGLHVWLPDAMEGPTPVSALIHAATMVTAGVFLVIRCSFLFELSPIVLWFVVFVGASTCCLTAFLGAFQYDIKKIVAYSTCSQLGYMFFAAGLSNYGISFFHLFNHAFFKALLFLSMGSIIHALYDEQDFRRMGGLLKLLPFTYTMVFLGSFALLGLPFLAGFYSKDLLLELTYTRFNLISNYAYFMGIMAAFFTAFYSTRLLYWVFLSRVHFFRIYLKTLHESEGHMLFVLACLGGLSIFVGYIFADLFIGLGSNFLTSAVFTDFSHVNIITAEFGLHWLFKLLPIISSLLGVVFFHIIKVRYKFFPFISRAWALLLFRVFSGLYFFDVFYSKLLLNQFLYLNYNFFFKHVEKFSFEWLGPFFFMHYSRILFFMAVNNSTNFLSVQLFLILFGLVLSILLFWLDLVVLTVLNVFFILIFFLLFFATRPSHNRTHY